MGCGLADAEEGEPGDVGWVLRGVVEGDNGTEGVTNEDDLNAVVSFNVPFGMYLVYLAILTFPPSAWPLPSVCRNATRSCKSET